MMIFGRQINLFNEGVHVPFSSRKLRKKFRCQSSDESRISTDPAVDLSNDDTRSGRLETKVLCATRDQVFSASVLRTTPILVGVAVGLRISAPAIYSFLHPDASSSMKATQLLDSWSQIPGIDSIGIGLAAATAVTLARLILLAVWPAFREESNAANTLVLSSLSLPDLLWAGALPAILEELLFRGALIPALSPDWRGAVVGGAVFGSLHVTGGRRSSFALWSALVGLLYGELLLYTDTVWACCIAHAGANIAGGAYWMIGARKK